MNSRPVLSMNFYESKSGEFFNPYQHMVEEAKKQRQTQERTKIQTINTTMQNIQELVDHFIPIEEAPEQKPDKKTNKNKQGKYRKQYFQTLDSNLKLINSYLQILEKQV